ncbi:MAG: MG2 domain-containing protein [Candidatus Zixiibacteriota bacterium]
MNALNQKSNDTQAGRSRGRFVHYSMIGLQLLIICVGNLLISCGDSGRETVRVESFSPEGETPRTTNITVLFGHEIVPDSAVAFPPADDVLEFDPAIPGKVQWIAGDKLRFYPDIILAPSTEYRASLSKKVASAYGVTLKGDREFSFKTARFRVNSASLMFEYTPESGKSANLVSSIEFNYDVDPHEAAKSISIKYKGGGNIPYNIITASQSSIISLRAEDVQRLDSDREIQLVVREGLQCIGGNLGLVADYITPAILPSQGNLVVESLKPVYGTPEQRSLRLNFNLPIDVATAARFISCDPSIDYKLTAEHYHIDLKGDFEDSKSYVVTIRKGLRAVDGSTLEREFSSSVTFQIEQIPPQVDFVGKGCYLTLGGNLNVGLSTINVDSATIEVDKIFANNLVYLLNSTGLETRQDYYGGGYNLNAVGKRIHSSDVQVARVENEEVITPINVREYLDADPKGIFKLTARIAERRWQQVSKWVVATDIGITVKRAGDDLWVWVNSLSTLDPVTGADIVLFSQNNQELMRVQSDRDGLVVFKAMMATESEYVPFLITAAFNDDLSFLKLPGNVIPTSDFNVGGLAQIQSGYEAFVYNERGIYRPGEIAHVAAIVRSVGAACPQPFPVILSVKGPDGRILSEQRAILNEQAAAEFSVPIPDYSKTGRYDAMLLLGTDDEIGRTSFNVEEFMPDRMKVKIKSDSDTYMAGSTADITVEAMTLFGPPAGGRRVSGDIEIEQFRFQPPDWSEFAFVDAEKSFSSTKIKLDDETLDEDGQFTYRVDIPAGMDPQSSLRGVISTTVLEPGGRGVSAYRGVIIHPHVTYVGIRRTEEGYAQPNAQTQHEFAVLDTEGNLVEGRKAEVRFYRVYWQSVLKRVSSRGGYRYESERVKNLIESFTVESGDGTGSFSVTPGDYGRYLVVVRDIESGASASLYFYASGWGYAPWAMDNPDRIEIDLDKETYLPGDKAQVQIRAPFAGKLLVTVEKDRLLSQRVITLEENTATITVPVEEDFLPNVYVSAHLIRSTKSLDRDTPVRAFGVVPLVVNTESRWLTVELDVPHEIRPKTTLPVEFRVTGQSGQTPYITIAAVDEGICQLTDFQTPDPQAFFYGKKRLMIDTYDIYGMILPEIESSLSATSGDVEAARKRHLTPISVTRVKPVAFWSGLVKIDSRGFGKVSFDIPQFNGTLRLMAVAAAGNRFGNAEREMFVREPIVLTPTFPRFIGSGDSFNVPVSVYNGTGEKATFEIKIDVDGPVACLGEQSQSVTIANDSEGFVLFAMKAEEKTGKVSFGIEASGGGERSSYSVDVPLRPPVPFTTLSGAGSLSEGKPVEFTFPVDWVPGTTDFSLSIAAFPAVRFTRSLQYLLQYPHGCVEQTTSRLFPLLYFEDIAKLAEPDLFKVNSATYFLEEGIARLENMQQSSGAFSYWPQGGYLNNWSSIYASHFLVEARRAGYTVSGRTYNRMISALKRSAKDYRMSERYSFQTVAYACYVLALAGEPNRNTMHFIKDNALDMLSEYSRYQLAGAFALSGDRNSAVSLLPKTATLPTDDSNRETGDNFNSPIRAQAIMLDVLAEVDANSPLIARLVANLTEAASKTGLWHSTQDNAFAFLALGKIMSKQTEAHYTGTITVDGKKLGDFGVENARFDSKEWAGKNVSIRTTGEGTCYYFWRADGLPSTLHIDEYDNDLIVRRRYLDENGNEMAYDRFRQGDMIVAEITVLAPTEPLSNVAIVDLLPAGFEIENPRLQSRRGIRWIGDKAYNPMYMDIRDDRLIIYGDFRHNRKEVFYYGLRAVTQGEFILPPVRAEAMYAPMKASVASSGNIKVVEH